MTFPGRAGTLLDEWMPRWDVADRHELTVAASTDRTYRAVRSVDFAASRLSRLLFTVRSLPLIVRGRRIPPSVTLEGVTRSGFTLLAEEPGREIVVGVVGRFWVLSGTARVTVGRDQFARHAAPGTAKAAMSFRVDPVGADRARVVTETRVLCADAAARRSFRRYWRVIRPGSALIRRIALAQIRREAEASAP